MQLLPMASSPDGLISAPVCGHHEDPRLGGAHHNPQRECHTRPWVLAHQCVTWGGGEGRRGLSILFTWGAIWYIGQYHDSTTGGPSVCGRRAGSIVRRQTSRGLRDEAPGRGQASLWLARPGQGHPCPELLTLAEPSLVDPQCARAYVYARACAHVPVSA